jgi:hypothetical protein
VCGAPLVAAEPPVAEEPEPDPAPDDPAPEPPVLLEAEVAPDDEPAPVRRPAEGLWIDAPPITVPPATPRPATEPVPLPPRPTEELPPLVPTWMVIAGALGLVALLIVLLLAR